MLLHVRVSVFDCHECPSHTCWEPSPLRILCFQWCPVSPHQNQNTQTNPISSSTNPNHHWLVVLNISYFPNCIHKYSQMICWLTYIFSWRGYDHQLTLQPANQFTFTTCEMWPAVATIVFNALHRVVTSASFRCHCYWPYAQQVKRPLG